MSLPITNFPCSADGNFTVKLMTKATIHFNGEVVWKPPAIYKSLCPINVEFFPFDEQSCTLKIGNTNCRRSRKVRNPAKIPKGLKYCKGPWKMVGVGIKAL